MQTILKHNTKTLTSPEMWMPSPMWQWRDRYGDRHHPGQMETRHLFHVFRMIWDHTMPREAQTHFPNRYVFGPHYTKEYFADAIRFCGGELFRRTDREAYMDYELERMMRWLQDNPNKIPKPYVYIMQMRRVS